MKVIVIEGLDNTGKSTIIGKIFEKLNNPMIIHCTKPAETDPICAAVDQAASFIGYVNNYINNPFIEKSSKVSAIIFDRSWVGEYVYGVLYRHNSDKFVERMIDHIHELLEKHELYYINLTVDDCNFCLSHEDGQSLSNSSLEKIEKERERFNEIFEKLQSKNSNLNYLKVIVNKSATEFRDINEITDEVFNFLKI